MADTNHGEDKEVKALLIIWGDTKIQEELDGALHNKELEHFAIAPHLACMHN